MNISSIIDLAITAAQKRSCRNSSRERVIQSCGQTVQRPHSRTSIACLKMSSVERKSILSSFKRLCSSKHEFDSRQAFHIIVLINSGFSPDHSRLCKSAVKTGIYSKQYWSAQEMEPGYMSVPGSIQVSAWNPKWILSNS